MTLKVLFRPQAETELVQSYDWYESRSPGLGAEYLRAVDAVIANIIRHPLAYPVVFDEVRRAVMRRFPFGIVYTINDEAIVILACFHASRDLATLR